MIRGVLLACGILVSFTVGVQLACAAPQFQAAPPNSVAPRSSVTDEVTLDSLLRSTAPAIRFRAGDILTVAVYNLGAFGGQQRVEQDGTIRFPFIGKIQVAGTTVDQLEESVATHLKADGIMRDPQVTVLVVAQPWNVITVSGDVAKPGVFPAVHNLTLLDYLAEAGGLQDNFPGANNATNSPASSLITLSRPSLGTPVNIQLGPAPDHSPYARIPLFAGDQLRVGRVGVVYAVGAFKSQGAFPLKNTSPTTVLEVAALAGGIGYEADTRDAAIIRTYGNSRYTIGIDIRKILKGTMRDIALQEGDILFVPTNQMKAAIKGGGAGALITLGAAAIYAHP